MLLVSNFSNGGKYLSPLKDITVSVPENWTHSPILPYWLYKGVTLEITDSIYIDFYLRIYLLVESFDEWK